MGHDMEKHSRGLFPHSGGNFRRFSGGPACRLCPFLSVPSHTDTSIWTSMELQVISHLQPLVHLPQHSFSSCLDFVQHGFPAHRNPNAPAIALFTIISEGIKCKPASEDVHRDNSTDIILFSILRCLIH